MLFSFQIKQFILKSDELEEVESDPIARKYLRQFSNGSDFINGDKRFCLWLKDAPPADIVRSAILKKRVDKLIEKRSGSDRPGTQKLAQFPTRFGEDRQPNEPFLAFPQTFTENRRYMTVGLMDPSVIIGMKIYWTIDPDGLQFALASSSMMITWQRTVGGRLKSDPSFSNTLVWNT
ncbi:MAG: type IIL restriction-modification enzyme MmeI, partial [Raineya sp.]